MKTIGSQIRETLAEAELTLVSLVDCEAILQDSDGKRELWYRNDFHAGYTVEINGIGYEFIRSV